jgi:steroid 5-alpha reductase family enzyme
MMSTKSQNLLTTSILLVIALILLPTFTIMYDQPLTDLQVHILERLLYAMLIVSSACFIVGEITKNLSQTDKVWSIAPAFYVWYVAYASNWQPRLMLMTGLVWIWSARLTYNFNRRGGYSFKFWSGEEDYRWAEVRKEKFMQKRWKITLFNFFFICLYQQSLILAFTLPALLCIYGDKPLGVFDYFLACIFLLFVIIETIADQQQWNYQKEKRRRKQANEPLSEEHEQGFISSGLWAIVRHPNYAAEQCIWITFYFFSVAATGRWINWSMAGCLLLILLFRGSANFSETITVGKYPKYREHQKKVGKFIPGLK